MNTLSTLVDFGLDGRAALSAAISASTYASLAQAVASLALFTHPDTVAQIPGEGALFPCIRGRHARRAFEEHAGVRLGVDDNAAAHTVFLWCNGLASLGRDNQLNHVYSRSGDPACYTAPANLCLCPSFLAKLSDHDQEIVALLKWRVFELYTWTPPNFAPPPKPSTYDALIWAPPLAPTPDLEAVLRARMRRRVRDFSVRMANELGWAFSGGAPDCTIRASRKSS